MILKEEIEKIANVKAQELNGCIVDVTISSANDIVVYFDKIGGVQIKECVTISKSINDYFDRDIEDYALTVCSPGLANPFKIKEQYEINKVKIRNFQVALFVGKPNLHNKPNFWAGGRAK